MKIAVDSTTLRAVAYDSDRKLMQLEFVNGSIYEYIDVPREVYQDLLAAPSKGHYFNRFIRDKFATSKVKAAAR